VEVSLAAVPVEAGKQSLDLRNESYFLTHVKPSER
jgi:hypothetical protein